MCLELPDPRRSRASELERPKFAEQPTLTQIHTLRFGVHDDFADAVTPACASYAFRFIKDFVGMCNKAMNDQLLLEL